MDYREAERRRYLQKKRARRKRRRIVLTIAYFLFITLLAVGIFLLVKQLLGERHTGTSDSPALSQGAEKPNGQSAPTNTPTPTPSPSPTPSPTPNVVSMVAVGDNLFDWYLLEAGSNGDGTFDFEAYYDNIKPYVGLGDFAVVNQETPLGGDGGYRGSGVEMDYIGSYNRWGSYHGYCTFNTPDEAGDALVAAGFNVISSATNHISDYGIEALHHTLDYWKKHPDVTVLGIHESQEDQDSIAVVEKYGIRIAMLNYTYGLNIDSAIKAESFSIDLLSESRVKKDVAKAKELADFVVVFVHWGTEYQMTTNAYQKDYTKLFLKCGVDVVVGAHPHISQPMEWLTGEDGHKMVVYYSLGNFISMFKDARCELEGMAYVEFYKDGETAYVQEGSIIPLVNHWSYNADVFGKREKFTVYALQDYNTELGKAHGCLHFSEGKKFSYAYMQELAKDLWGDYIKTVDWDAQTAQ